MPNDDPRKPANDAAEPDSIQILLARIERQLDRIASALEAAAPLSGDIRKDLGPTRTAPIQVVGKTPR